MSTQRWLLFALSIAVGIGLGLVYGWVVSPVQYVDTIPATLREDFKADYTLMVAESYQSDQDADQAARRLATLGSQHPAQIVANAIIFAQKNHYADADISLLQNLAVALQVWEPATGNNQPTAAPTGSQP